MRFDSSGWCAPRGHRGLRFVALAGVVLGLQIMHAAPAAAAPGATGAAADGQPGAAPPPTNPDGTPAPGPDAPPANPAAPPPVTPAPPANPDGAAAPADAPAGAAPAGAAGKPKGKPDPLRNNLRLNVRFGAPTDLSSSKHISDNSIGATYFMNDKAYSLFANLEAVYLTLNKGYDHFESEINLGISPFYARPWLAPVSFTMRVTTDWTDQQTLSYGPSVNLTNIPFMAPVKAAGFNFFFQYYPLKTDNHWGDQDFLFYWSIPIWARRLSLRGFARLFISYHNAQQAAISNDLIFELVPGVDIYLRDAESINESDIPRRDGLSLGLRWLQKF